MKSGGGTGQGAFGLACLWNKRTRAGEDGRRRSVDVCVGGSGGFGEAGQNVQDNSGFLAMPPVWSFSPSHFLLMMMIVVIINIVIFHSRNRYISQFPFRFLFLAHCINQFPHSSSYYCFLHAIQPSSLQPSPSPSLAFSIKQCTNIALTPTRTPAPPSSS